jgi:photosystem II stability/assembly factor-like uncharacterized protein
VSSENGENWIDVNSDLPAKIYVDAIAINGNNIFIGTTSIVANCGVFRSSNKGNSWTALYNGLPTYTLIDAAIAISGNNIFIGTTDGKVFLSSNNGTSWAERKSGLPGTWIRKLSISGDNLFAATLAKGVYLSSNNGSSWAAVNNGLPSDARVHALATSGENVFAGTQFNGTYFSPNNGQNWTVVNNGLPANAIVVAFAISGNNIFAGTNGGGVYLSANNGSNWTAVNTGLGNDTIRSLAVSSTYLYAGTVSDGVWKRPLSSITTGTVESFPQESNVAIFPNPANNVVTIESQWPSIIKVFNIQGQLVKTLQTSSNKTMVDVSALPDGIYIMKANTNKGVFTLKFIKQ